MLPCLRIVPSPLLLSCAAPFACRPFLPTLLMLPCPAPSADLPHPARHLSCCPVLPHPLLVLPRPVPRCPPLLICCFSCLTLPHPAPPLILVFPTPPRVPPRVTPVPPPPLVPSLHTRRKGRRARVIKEDRRQNSKIGQDTPYYFLPAVHY